jgi:hypothetical protein
MAQSQTYLGLEQPAEYKAGLNAQIELESMWSYKRTPCPNLSAKFIDLIANYSVKSLEFGCDKSRSNREKALPIEDYVIFFEGRVGATHSVNRSRNQGMTFNFHPMGIICWIPSTNQIWAREYTSYN